MSCDQPPAPPALPGPCDKRNVLAEQSPTDRRSNFWSAVPQELCGIAVVTIDNNNVKEACQQQPNKLELPLLDCSGDPFKQNFGSSGCQLPQNTIESCPPPPSVEKLIVVQSDCPSSPVLDPVEPICTSSTDNVKNNVTLDNLPPPPCVDNINSVTLEALPPPPCVDNVNSVTLDTLPPSRCADNVNSVTLDTLPPSKCLDNVNSVTLDTLPPSKCLDNVNSVTLDTLPPPPCVDNVNNVTLDTSPALPSPPCLEEPVRSDPCESPATPPVLNNDSCDGSQNQETKVEDSADPEEFCEPPNPELCEKFRNFALGTAEPEPENCDEPYDPVQVCENIFGCNLHEDEKKGSQDEIIQVEIVEETCEEKLARICFDDGTKTETFQVTHNEGFVCPPMPPSNIPQLSFPGWFECPPNITVSRYPVPPGVKIVPMTKGLRTNFDRNPICRTCGSKRQKNVDKLCTEKCKDSNCPALKKINKDTCPTNEKSVEMLQEVVTTAQKAVQGVKSLFGFK